VARNINGLKRGAGPGRPKGVPNKASLEAKAACTALVDDPGYRRALAARLRSGKLAPAVETMLWYYAKGKPKDHVDVGGPQRMIISWMSNDEPSESLPPVKP